MKYHITTIIIYTHRINNTEADIWTDDLEALRAELTEKHNCQRIGFVYDEKLNSNE